MGKECQSHRTAAVLPLAVDSAVDEIVLHQQEGEDALPHPLREEPGQIARLLAGKGQCVFVFVCACECEAQGVAGHIINARKREGSERDSIKREKETEETKEKQKREKQDQERTRNEDSKREHEIKRERERTRDQRERETE